MGFGSFEARSRALSYLLIWSFLRFFFHRIECHGAAMENLGFPRYVPLLVHGSGNLVSNYSEFGRLDQFPVCIEFVAMDPDLAPSIYPC